MKNKKFNKLIAAMLAGTMVFGMGTTAFAADGDPAGTGNTTGAGAFEGHVDKDVLSVQLPTTPAATTFAYTMDPEGLIAATEGAKDKTASFEEGATVYFLSAEKTYTKDSAKLNVVNKGTVDADVTVKAETAANANVAMAESNAFEADDTAAKLYLGLKVAAKDAVAVKATGDASPASVTVGLKGAPDNYEVKYDSATQKYSYAAKADVAEAAWNSFEFGLTGACNPKGDYSDADLEAADVTVTWSYVKHADGTEMLPENKTTDAAPSIQAEAFDYERDAELDITVNMGAGTLAATSIQKVEASNNGTDVTADFTSVCTISGNKITLSSGQFGGASVGDARYLIVTFDNGSTVRAALNIVK